MPGIVPNTTATDGRLTSRLYHRQVSFTDFQLADYDRRRVSVAVNLSCITSANSYVTIGQPGKGLRLSMFNNIVKARSITTVLTVDDIGEQVQDEIWFTDLENGTTPCFVTTCRCEEQCDTITPWSTMPNYDYGQSVLSGIAVNTPTQGLPSRSFRRVLTISCDNPGGGALNFLFVGTKPLIGTNLLQLALPCFIVMPYRDWGPIICEPIWLYTNRAGTTITLSEVWALPN